MHIFLYIVHTKRIVGFLKATIACCAGKVFVQINQKILWIVQRFLRYPSFFKKIA